MSSSIAEDSTHPGDDRPPCKKVEAIIVPPRELTYLVRPPTELTSIAAGAALGGLLFFALGLLVGARYK